MNTRNISRRRSRSARVRALGWLAVISSLTLALFAPSGAALATQPDPLHRVTICHRTSATANPYVAVTVDEASVDGDAGNDRGKGDHLIEHTGPVWTSDQPNGGDWGDIIPPFYSDGATLTGYASLNWDAAGQAIFDNACNPVEEEAVEPPATETVTPSPEPTDEPVGSIDDETVTPTEEPTEAPTDEPTGTVDDETVTPTEEPTEAPTDEPTGTVDDETVTPTEEPTEAPTDEPTGTVDDETGAAAQADEPTGEVAGAQGTPRVTLPPTSTLDEPGSTPGTDGWRLMLVGFAAVLVGLLMLVPDDRTVRVRSRR